MIVNYNGKDVKLPDFFIVGAAKSGTTSMADNLAHHPEIFMSPIKEPAYFVKAAGWNNYDEYLSLFEKAGNAKAVGEASTAYLFDDDAPCAIYKHFPDAKIIIILRNPIDRAFSEWRYLRLVAYEAKSFEEAISSSERDYRKTEEFKKKAFPWWASYLYLERSLYCSRVKMYFDIFGRDRIKVYIFEDFIKNQRESYKSIFEFLRVNANFIPDFSISNEGGEGRFKFLKDLLHVRSPFLKKIIPPAYRQRIRNFILRVNTKNVNKQEINPATRKSLEAFFYDDICKLEGLLGYEIKAWKKTTQ